MGSESTSIMDHYTRSKLMKRIRNALLAAGHDPDKPTEAMLSELDHLHGGDFTTTELQAEVAEIPKGCHVLDAGCGIGGPSRYLAHSYGCTVEAICLSPEYVEVAGWLNELAGLADMISLRIGSVTELPYDDAIFDVVLCQNATMNVSDKPAMFREAHRVLKPGGTYTFRHLVDDPNGRPIFPRPWAPVSDVNALETPEEIFDLLSDAGFEKIEDQASQARSGAGGSPQSATLGAVPAFGDDMPERIKKSGRSKDEDWLKSMMVVARRPS